MVPPLPLRYSLTGIGESDHADVGEVAFRRFACVFVVMLLAIVLWVYRAHGRKCQAMIFVYLFALVSTQASVTLVFRACPSFHAPCLLTTAQLLFQVIVSHFLLQLQHFRKGQRSLGVYSLLDTIGVAGWISAFLPLALCLAVSVVAHNASIMYIGLGVSSILSAFTPALTTLFCVIMGQRFPRGAWAGIAVVCLGAMIAVYGMHLETADLRKAVGFCLCIAALVARALKTTLQDAVMKRPFAELQVIAPFGKSSLPAASYLDGAALTGTSQQKLAPMEVWALQSPLMFVICAAMSLAVEGMGPWRQIFLLDPQMPRSEVHMLFILLCVTSVLSALLGLVSLSVVQFLGAAASQIVGKLNIIITALLACTVLKESIGGGELIGGLTLVIGAYIFEREVRAAEPTPEPEQNSNMI